MSSISALHLLTILVLQYCALSASSLRIHVVSWNVADNKRMNGDLPGNILENLLRSDKAADVVAVSFQENCFECDNDDVTKISDLIRVQLKSLYDIDYIVNGIEMTRDSSKCELFACYLSGLHGTTIMMVFSRPGVVSSNSLSQLFKVNDCQQSVLGFTNSEKGIAAVKITLSDNQKLCFAGSHLDSESPRERQACVKRFFTETSSWKDCDKFYLMGDFNTRTAENREENGKKGINLSTDTVNQLFLQDEMVGQQPYGGTTLLSHISEQSGKTFEEPIVDVATFMPTYSLLHSGKYCDGQQPCYREARSPAWTDRIVCHNCGEVVRYTSVSLLGDYSDHLPVVGIYE